MTTHDRSLGMDRQITRRDFLNGVALTAGASLLPLESLLAQESGPDASTLEPFLAQGITQQDPRYYPPALTGMRGSHPGSFEVAHSLRDGKRWDDVGAEADTGEKYDLVVVGGGLSGLAAAYFFRKANGPQSKILILENHDDFGGHAKRNEFQSGKFFLLGHGGTQEIEEPDDWSAEAMGLIRELGVDIQRFAKYYDNDFRNSRGLSHGVFFCKETFGEDRLVMKEGLPSWQEYVSRTPLSEKAREDLVRIQTTRVDYLPGLSVEEKKKRLSTMSLRTFLVDHAKTDPQVADYWQSFTQGLFGLNIDAVSALYPLQNAANRLKYWGGPAGPSTVIADGMGLEQYSVDPIYFYHFPDGNASLARLLVRALIPGCAPGNTMEDIVTARMDYTRLDQPSSSVRIRLNSTAVRVKHLGDPEKAQEVEITYVLNGKPHKIRGNGCVLACFNMIIPHLCPELPPRQKEALGAGVKVPLVYMKVQLRDWKALQKLGFATACCPGSYVTEVYMDFPVSMGDYHYTRSPEEPCVLHLVRTPNKPGLPVRDQRRAGQMELYVTPFSTFEHKIREQFARMFGPAGFDPARDIEAITVNRWPHGYADSFQELGDPDWAPSERPNVVGRQRFGRISIANSDAGAQAQTQAAFDQAYRAVREVMSLRGSKGA